MTGRSPLSVTEAGHTNPEERTVNTSGNASPDEPRRSGVASRAQLVMFRGVWAVGALAVVTAVLLIIGALTANRAAGELWQPAALLGLIALCFGGTLLLVGLLARRVVTKSGTHKSP
ncbi:hypothetical protein [Streptomyces sioyaensis]|uniref:hypothetical protein n=1 Tax=Streptomyces sioyaensis TaxID=67364 RepID=UPI003D708066